MKKALDPLFDLSDRFLIKLAEMIHLHSETRQIESVLRQPLYRLYVIHFLIRTKKTAIALIDCFE